MREIKFRVRDIDTKKIVAYEWVGEDDKWMHWLVSSNDGLLGIGACPGNGPREQYTGIKASDGVEIYEGDVLKGKFGDTEAVKWSDAMCGFFIVGQWWSGEFPDWQGAAVIGTIHDPEYAELAK